MKTTTGGTVIRENVRGWRLPNAAGRVKPRGLSLPEKPLSVQIHRWTLAATVVFLGVFLGGLFYLDALTGYWLGAVMGRLSLGVFLLFLLGCFLGGSRLQEKRR